jgi:3-oxoacyl-(acyl-carrier-protein) synthase
MTVRCQADILATGSVWPGPVPVARPAPAGLPPEDWPAYRLDPTTEASLLPPERIKRMGRGQMMTIGAVKAAVDCCAELPERGGGTAIVLGTAWAEEGDEIVFLQNLIARGEKGAKPAFFVNSVKNALASQLALHFGFQGENQTFAHDALSFESALWQGARLLRAGRARHAIVCGVEALVPFQEIHGHLLGRYGTEPTPLVPLASGTAPSGRKTLPGEGAAAFVLAPPGTAEGRLACLAGLRARGPARRWPVLSVSEELAFVEQGLREAATCLSDVDLVLVGANGDPVLDAVYAGVIGELRERSRQIAVGVYRHRTGDFATASALAFDLAVRAADSGALPTEVQVVAGTVGRLERVLLYHLTSAGYHSVIIVSA